MTGLAGTALLAHGDSPTRGKYSKTVQGAVEFLVRCATPTGLITGPNQDSGMPMHGHGFALLFLASVYGMITKESLRKQVQVAIRKAVTLTSQGQSAAGGWTYTPGSGDEGSVTVTQVQALRAAHNAGFLVPRAVIEESVKYLEKCRTPEGGIQYSLGSGGGPRLAISAAAVATLYNAGQFEGEIATDCLKYVWDQFRANEGWNKGGGHAFYSHLYASQGFYMAGDQYWDKYFPGARDQLLAMQSPDGSWQRRRDRRGLRHRHRRDHLAASVQVSAGFSALEDLSRRWEGEAPSEPDEAAGAARTEPRPPGTGPTLNHKGGDAILSTTTTDEIDLAELQELRKAHDQIREQMARQIVGQNEVVEQLLMAVFARGHCILEGVPGLAKTLMVHSLAQSLSLDFTRIQFTPDLMPSDITGTEVLYEDRQTGARELRFVQGPIFANLVLADEINRTPPKTQAALLEAMQERQVTAGGRRHVLPEPFFVLATQNPIEQEGTYPLPEAQLDRFLFKVFITYPKPEEERRIYRLTTGVEEHEITPMLTGERITALQRVVRRVPVSDHCLDYAMDLVRATRGPAHGGPAYINEWVAWGAGPRAGQSLILAAKARAALAGRPSVSVDDIRAIALPVLRHRIVINYNAQAVGESSDSIIKKLLDDVPVRKGAADAAVAEVFRS